MSQPIAGVGSDGKTIALTLWKEGERPIVKIMSPHEAIQLAHRINVEAVRLIGVESK